MDGTWMPYNDGKIRFVPPQLREIGCHVQNHVTQWHGFQHEIQLQEIVVAWIKMTLNKKISENPITCGVGYWFCKSTSPYWIYWH
jgi:hypothetical protein